jgi:DNA-directed RNA polymerase subunit RPC12/RpoP
MGQRRTCPNCEALFVAGKSVAEANGHANGAARRGLLERAGAEAPSARPPIDRTMLGEVAAMIRYNCPRCKKPLESPASEAGMKKPCPDCGGRLQVPAQPAGAPAPDPLNKTLLASADSAAPAGSH